MAQMTPAPQNFMEPIRSAIAETLGLSYADVLPQILHLRATLDANVTTGLDEYRIDGGYHFLVWEAHAHLSPNVLLPAGAYSGIDINPDVVRRYHEAKAWNCRVSLYNPDREAMKYVETDVQNSAGNTATSLCLGTILKRPVKFCEGNDIMPLLVMENDRLRMSAQLVQPGLELAPGVPFLSESTEYGLTLIGAFIRARTT
jgi:hypothetical protein